MSRSGNRRWCNRAARGAIAGLSALALLATAASAPATAGGVKYQGRTDQGREIKLVADRGGVIKRGTFVARTICSGKFKPFVGALSFNRPLDRSTRRGFRDAGAKLDTDGTYTGRYKYEIRGKRKSGRKIKGTLDLEIVFRKNDRKYTTCRAEDLAYTVKSAARKSNR